MAWVKNTTDAGEHYFASMFGTTPNITRVVPGMTYVTADEIFNLTDVVDPIMIDDPDSPGNLIEKLFDILPPITVEGNTSKMNVRLDNVGITTATPFASIFVFAELGDGNETLIYAWSNSTPQTIEPYSTFPGWFVKPQMNLTFANGSITGNINWGAYADVGTVADMIAPVEQYVTAVDGANQANTAALAAHNADTGAYDGTSHPQIRGLITDETDRAELAESGLQTQVNTATQSINSLKGLGGSLTHNDFGATPTQEQLTEYACVGIWGDYDDSAGVFTWNSTTPSASTYVIDSVTHTASEIFNGTWVRNDSDNCKWVINNTPSTIPAVFEWTNVGVDTVSIATETTAGLIKSASAPTVNPDGTNTANGGDTVVNPVTGETTVPTKQNKLSTVQLAAANSGITAAAVDKYDKVTFILPTNAVQICENVLIKDDLGIASVMVRIRKFYLDEVIAGAPHLPHPAFIINGVERDEFYIGKYQAVVINGRAYSLPMKDPVTSVNFDQALTYCSAKGTGWHLVTNAEWSAVALLSKALGTMPHGNNANLADCSDIEFPQEKMIRAATAVGTEYRGLTGSGPVTFNHNFHESGICDMNGNVWEHTAGVKTVNGEIQLIPNNDAADNTVDQSATSTAYKAILANGNLVAPGTANTLKYNVSGAAASGTIPWGGIQVATAVTASTTDTTYVVPTFGSVTNAVSGAGIDLLKSLALFPNGNAAAHGNDTMWCRNNGERVASRGGTWHHGASYGVFALSLNAARSLAHASLGFRAAFCPL